MSLENQPTLKSGASPEPVFSHTMQGILYGAGAGFCFAGGIAGIIANVPESGLIIEAGVLCAAKSSYEFSSVSTTTEDD